MSITFYIGEERDDGAIWPAESCDCSRRWCDACDAAWAKDLDAPDQFSCDVCDSEINMSNANAGDLLVWVGLPNEYCGNVSASDLAPILRRRLWDESRNHDAATSGEESGGPGTGQCRMISMGRTSGYLRQRCEQLLATCERAGDRLIVWA
jgi:hypothetical protein